MPGAVVVSFLRYVVVTAEIAREKMAAWRGGVRSLRAGHWRSTSVLWGLRGQDFQWRGTTLNDLTSII